MKILPYDSASYYRVRDIPRLLWIGLTGRMFGWTLKVSARVVLIAMGFIVLSGCATKFVRVPCLTKEQYEERVKAEPEKVGGQLTGKADQDIKPIAGSAVELRAWGRGNLDILGGCAG